MKILVMGGMHGNEPLGPDIVRLFRDKPVRGVDTVLANEQALSANVRFIKHDLNRSFPGNARSKEYEPRRAAELLRLTRKYDIVLDFHNTHCPNNDCGFVGEGAKQLLPPAAAWLGLDRLIVADYDCLNKFAANCLSVEISLPSDKRAAADWYKKISKLAQTTILSPALAVQTYRFAYRMTLDDKEMFNLAGENIKAFQPIKPEIAAKLGVKNPAFPIFVNDKYTPYNYGGLLNKID